MVKYIHNYTNIHALKKYRQVYKCVHIHTSLQSGVVMWTNSFLLGIFLNASTRVQQQKRGNIQDITVHFTLRAHAYVLIFFNLKISTFCNICDCFSYIYLLFLTFSLSLNFYLYLRVEPSATVSVIFYSNSCSRKDMK